MINEGGREGRGEEEKRGKGEKKEEGEEAFHGVRFGQARFMGIIPLLGGKGECARNGQNGGILRVQTTSVGYLNESGHDLKRVRTRLRSCPDRI